MPSRASCRPWWTGSSPVSRSRPTSPGTTRRWRWRSRAISTPAAVVYDCMDELSAFAGAPPGLRAGRAGAAGRAPTSCSPAGRACTRRSGGCTRTSTRFRAASTSRISRGRASSGRIPPIRPRSAGRGSGFFGVIDERLDIELVAGAAAAAARLAVRDHRTGRQDRSGDAAEGAPTSTTSGAKSYDELPDYIAGWDVALLPFARNESTRFISPTKTPEYLAAGRPVVSTSIRDVVRPYGDLGLARIADTADETSSRRSSAALAEPDERPAVGGRRVPGRHVVGLDVGEHVAPGRGRAAAEPSASTAGEHAVAQDRDRDTDRRCGGDSVIPGRDASMFDYLVVGAGFAGCGHRRAAGGRAPARKC